jgi:hypothetical protein
MPAELIFCNRKKYKFPVLKISKFEFSVLAGKDIVKKLRLYGTNLKARSAVDFSRLRLICCCSE